METELMGNVIASGRRYWDVRDMDGGVDWVLLRAYDVGAMSDEEIICDLNLYTYEGGPGRLFYSDAWVERGKYKVLVQQEWGYDI
jgi:hypothetical protein